MKMTIGTVLPLSLLLGCGVVTEQECDECFEDARFHQACDNYFAEQYSIAFDCYNGIELDSDCFCNGEDVDNDACFIDGMFQLGAYEYETPECVIEFDPLETQCDSLSDHYNSCTNWKNSKKEAFSKAEQKEYYSSDECRRWAWDDEDWSLEKAVETRDCEAFAQMIGLEQLLD
jgi:hypothetical protein